jgi:MFS family permease
LLLGPVFGGLVIAAARVNTPFYIYGVVCLLFFPLSMRALRGEHAAPRTVPPGAAESAAPAVPSWQRIKPLLASKAYRAALGASAVSFIVTSAPQTLLPRYWTDTLHLSKASSGLPFFAEALAGMIVIWHAGALSDRRGRKFVLVPAMGACAVASLALGVFGGAVALLILMGALGLTNGYTRPGPTAIIADVSSPESRAVAVSGYRIAGDVGALIGPLLAGVLAEFVGYGWAWVGVAACVFVVFGMTVAAEETAPIEQPS